MAAGRKKEEVITFKADENLAGALEGIKNRSAFIRDAVLAALGNTCPVCHGTGILSVSQQSHWTEFNEHHHVEECEHCHEAHLVCEHENHKNGGRVPK